jgi:hypothetical protein
MAHLQKTGGFDRREALRRLITGAGAAGAAAALPTTVPAKVDPAVETAPQQTASAPAMSLGAAEPPDPILMAADWKPRFLDDHQDQTVLAVADLLIPDTDTPGARAAKVDRFIDLLLATDAPGTGEESGGTDFTDLLIRKGSLEGQKRYIAALNWLDGYCLRQFSNPFTGLSRANQETVLDMLTHANDNPEVATGHESFALIKNSIVMAYYSSEVGTLQELKYQTNPYQTGIPGCDHPEH